MRRLCFSVLVILSFSLANGQKLTVTEFDLYGCWVLEKAGKEEQVSRTAYKRCWTVNPKMKISSSAFSLLAYGNAEIQRWSPNVCPTTYTDTGKWSFDEENKIATISYRQRLLKDLKRDHPEEYKKFGSPERLIWKKFKVLSLSKNGMEIEVISN